MLIHSDNKCLLPIFSQSVNIVWLLKQTRIFPFFLSPLTWPEYWQSDPSPTIFGRSCFALFNYLYHNQNWHSFQIIGISWKKYENKFTFRHFSKSLNCISYRYLKCLLIYFNNESNSFGKNLFPSHEMKKHDRSPKFLILLIIFIIYTQSS